MGSNHTLRPSEGETVTRAAPCRAPLRRWEWRAVADEQSACAFVHGPPGGTLADLRLRPACRPNPVDLTGSPTPRQTSANCVRREKAALSSGGEPHPADAPA